MLVHILDSATQKVFPVYTSSSAKILDVKEEFCEEHHLQIDQIRLLFQGLALDESRHVADYDIEHNATLQLVKIDKPKVVGPSITVFIKTLTGKTISILIYPSSTVLDLKEAIECKEDIPSDQQRLVGAGRQLEDERTLAEYNITDGVMIHLVQKLRGGAMFNFIFSDVKQDFETRKPAQKAPKYRLYGYGVNSEAVCENGKCEAFNKRFICSHGYGLYRLNEDPSVCPCCMKASSTTQSFAFSRAKIVIRSSVLKENSVKIRRDLEETEGNYKKLPEANENNTVGYEFVEIFSCSLDSSISLDSFGTCKTCCRTVLGGAACLHGKRDTSRQVGIVRPLPAKN